MPQGYELQEAEQDPKRATFILPGGQETLAAKFPDHPYERGDLMGTLEGDRQAVFLVMLVPLTPTDDASLWWTGDRGLFVPPDVTDSAIHERFCENVLAPFRKRNRISFFDSGSQAGRCAARITDELAVTFVRRLDGHLLIVGGVDLVELLILNKKLSREAFLKMTDAEKWKALSAAANAEVAERALLSARLP
ncbi:hypothetical protein [Pelagibius sp.]|uniref:hypothetical protein n=1 Tax=Pelagibius sp. TaxID=1931238 RepID=UPI002613D8A3|nr:hypothetical protein [Pelagibius sp.]